MKFYEYGTENIKTLLFFQATAEPWWIFEPSAKSLADEFHVFLAASDGHDPSQDNDYESVEKNTLEAAGLLREKGITHLDAIYGPCIGGASALRFLVTQDITVDKVIIDSGLRYRDRGARPGRGCRRLRGGVSPRSVRPAGGVRR